MPGEPSQTPRAETRRLAAIMFTDIVGFSRQMGADEGRMLRLLDVHNRIVQQAVNAHHGSVIKTIGDAFLVDFPSVVHAVQCGQAIQQQLRIHNAEKEKTEQLHVRIGIHLDDPPEQVLAGVPRCIFSNFEGYKRAIEIANSPNIGVCLCCGSWLEGGKMTGAEPVEMIRYFGSRKKLFKIHFRNVSAPLPHFTETMIDDGYYDMSKIMRALVEVKFEGIVIPDHVPGLGSDPRTEVPGGRGSAGAGFRPSPALAYLIGSMQAMLVAAQGKKS